MLGYHDSSLTNKGRILCGPDHKIGKNLIQMVRDEEKYNVFFPEFPCLHTRKSRIVITFSAFKEAGMMELHGIT